MQSSNRGFTLIELMVSLIISLIMIAVVGQMFIGNKDTYRANDTLSRLQENGRFAMEFIARDIRQADFWGCAEVVPPANVNNTLDTTDPAYDPQYHDLVNQEGVQGTDGGGLNGSDSITVRGGAFDSMVLVAPPATTAAALLVNNTGSTAPGGASIQHNSGGATSPGNATAGLQKIYNPPAQILVARTVTYTLGTAANGEPALMRSIDGAAVQELVQGVEDMQVLYGEDTNGDQTVDRYITAAQVTTWANVMSVQLNLLVRSEQEINEAPISVNFNGGVVNPADRRSRRVFTGTISLRNRMS